MTKIGAPPLSRLFVVIGFRVFLLKERLQLSAFRPGPFANCHSSQQFLVRAELNSTANASRMDRGLRLRLDDIGKTMAQQIEQTAP